MATRAGGEEEAAQPGRFSAVFGRLRVQGWAPPRTFLPQLLLLLHQELLLLHQLLLLLHQLLLLLPQGPHLILVFGQLGSFDFPPHLSDVLSSLIDDLPHLDDFPLQLDQGFIHIHCHDPCVKKVP